MSAVRLPRTERGFDLRARVKSENIFAARERVTNNARSELGRNDNFSVTIS
jgi:hypothetical protein